MVRRGRIASFAMIMATVATLSFAPMAEALELQRGHISNGYLANAGAWFLHTGTGDRTFTQHVTFAVPFTSTPAVMVALSGVYAGDPGRVRLYVSAKNVTPYGFDVEYLTSSNSIIYGGSASWIAFVP